MVAELHVDQPAGARGAEWCTQAGFEYRFDWGPDGLRTLAPISEVVVIVDVFSKKTPRIPVRVIESCRDRLRRYDAVNREP